MSVIKKVKKHFHKHKSIPAVLIVLFIALITTILLIVIIPRTNENSKKQTLKPTNISKTSSTTTVSGTVEDLTAKAPTEGDLQYEFIRIYNKQGSDTPRYIYYTTEFLDDRLIQLNDQIIANLKQEGKINDQTTAYSIDYFNDKTVANTYFEKMNNSSTTTTERLKLVSKYIAIMNYSTKINLSSMIKVSSSAVLKKY